MAKAYDQALDDFAADLAREYLRIFHDRDDLPADERTALAGAIAARDKPAIRRLIGGADMRLERAILEATSRVASRHLPAVAGDEAARAALSGMVQSATKALVAGANAGIDLVVNVGASRARYEPWNLLRAVGLTEPQARLYFATIRAAQDIAESIPRNAATTSALIEAARAAVKGAGISVRREIAPILRDPANREKADAAIRALSDRLRKHHVGPAAHVAAHTLIEEARLQQVTRDIASGKLPANTRKRWTNPLDERTRSDHGNAARANTSVAVDQPFTTAWGPLQAPPPPGVHAYHCRCRAEYFIPSERTDKSPSP